MVKRAAAQSGGHTSATTGGKAKAKPGGRKSKKAAQTPAVTPVVANGSAASEQTMNLTERRSARLASKHTPTQAKEVSRRRQVSTHNLMCCVKSSLRACL